LPAAALETGVIAKVNGTFGATPFRDGVTGEAR
jgi:hypothetical protein